MEIIELTSDDASARVAARGAQVLDAGLRGVPLLWLSPLVLDQVQNPGQAVRGGVPVCFPWFGRRQGMLAHGFARNRDWRLAERSSDRVVFALDDDDETRALWPHRFHAELALRLDEALNFDFTVTNRDDAAFTFTYALHSYFAVTEPDGVDGLDGFTIPIDAVFERAPDRLVLRGADRRITIESRNMASAVVWNPGPNDVPDIGEEWRDFVCVERGNIGAAAVTLDPDQRHTASMRLTVAGAGCP